MRNLRPLLEALVVGLFVHPLGQAVARVLAPDLGGGSRDASFEEALVGDALFTVPAVVAVMLLALPAWALAQLWPANPSVAVAVVVVRVCSPLLALAYQVQCSRLAHTDPQAPIAFLFVPFFAAAGAAALALGAGVGHGLVRRAWPSGPR